MERNGFLLLKNRREKRKSFRLVWSILKGLNVGALSIPNFQILNRLKNIYINIYKRKRQVFLPVLIYIIGEENLRLLITLSGAL